MTIVVIDDHRMFRESIVSFFEAESFCERALPAASVAEGKQLIEQHAPEVALVDMSFPGEGGIALAEWARNEAPGTACVFLTMHEEISNLRTAVAAGARGYVTKNAGYDELRAAVTVVEKGGLYLDQVMLQRVFRSMGNGESDRGGAPSVFVGLTEREREICNLMLQEMSTAEIGDVLYISTKTVENHRSSIYRKLGVHDRLSLLSFARKHGIIT